MKRIFTYLTYWPNFSYDLHHYLANFLITHFVFPQLRYSSLLPISFVVAYLTHTPSFPKETEKTDNKLFTRLDVNLDVNLYIQSTR